MHQCMVGGRVVAPVPHPGGVGRRSHHELEASAYVRCLYCLLEALFLLA